MAKAKDKSFDWRMQGMVYALQIAKEQWIEALEKEMRMRQILRADIGISKKQIDEMMSYINENVYNNMLTCAAWALREVFDFGKERIHRWKNKFDETVYLATDLDYLGEHYVTLEDIAVELNQKYDLGINMELVAACGDLVDEQDMNYRNKMFMAHIDKVLRAGGYEAAADYLKEVEGDG